MSPVIRLTLASVLLLVGAAQGAPAPEWLQAKNARTERVAERVFGGQVAVYRAGPAGAPPVVLVHGLGQSGAADWRELIPALAADYDVYALDLPGFGASDKGNHLYSPANQARVIESVIGARVDKPFALIGHSMGGAVALAYAHAYPQRVGRLILVDMAGVLHRSVYAEFLSRLGAEEIGIQPEGAPWFEDVVRTILTQVDALPLASELLLEIPPVREKLFRGNPNAIAAYALVEHDFSEALRSVQAPTLLIWGDDDRVAPLRTGQLAAATLPRARLEVLAGGGHMPQRQLPERFNALVLGELRAPPRERAAPVKAKSARAGKQRCDGRSGTRYTGEIAELSLRDCSDALVQDARIGKLIVAGGSVRLVNVEIVDGIDASNARIELTAGSVGGSPPLRLADSVVDAAATRFDANGPIAVNRGAAPVRLHFSVAEARGSEPGFIHETVVLAPDENW